MGPDGCDLLYTGKLARWLDTQRRLKRGTHGSERLTPEREALLQGLVDQGVLLWDQVPCRLKSNKMLQTTLPVQDVEEVAQETRDAVGGDNSGVEGQEEFVSVTRVDIQGEEIPETIDGQEEIVHGPALELSAEGNGMEIADIEVPLATVSVMYISFSCCKSLITNQKLFSLNTSNCYVSLQAAVNETVQAQIQDI